MKNVLYMLRQIIVAHRNTFALPVLRLNIPGHIKAKTLLFLILAVCLIIYLAELE